MSTEENHIRILTQELDGRSISNPAYESHKRGRNWAAIVSGKNAANFARSYLKTRRETVDLEPVKAGDVLEFGGDYMTCAGRRVPDRRWFHVHHIDDELVKFVRYPTMAKALKAARTAPPEECISADPERAMLNAANPAPNTIETAGDAT